MSLTVLFDLDDTLLKNDINLFLPGYLKALGKHLAQYVDPNHMIKQLLAATDLMVHNDDPRNTLEKAFDSGFYPAIGKSKDELQAVLEYFYEDVFPTLQPLTGLMPGAHELVQGATQQGHTLVIATNPLFPRRAIEHRLQWTGTIEQGNPFTLITSFETFHFSKPNPAYYAEILAQLGWPDQPAVVIGNSLEDDLLPASALGIPGYWVTSSPDPLPAGLHRLSAKGPLEGVLDWISTLDAANLPVEELAPAGLLAVLKSTPAAFDTLTRRLSKKQWEDRPEPSEWSVTEILCHLRDVDLEVNLPRMRKVAAGDNPFLPGINSDTWAEERRYCQQDGASALQSFIEARLQLLNCLVNLEPQAWSFSARHAIFGPTRLQELVSFMTTHDRSHIQQMASAAKQLE